METITITLDGVEVSGYSGMTILDLAQESGIVIPTLCDESPLLPTGSCRLCIVEEESSKRLLAACVSPITPGMVINTRSSRVIERRKVIVELILASHPDSCLVCDKGNRCQLRKIASDLGIGMVEFKRIPQLSVIEQVNPFIERDLSKCILCGKCIRADHQLVVEGAIDYKDRGFFSRPATLNDLPLEKSDCTFCGTCVALCPTGALMEKEKTYHGTTNATINTICPFCGCGCSICLEVKDNHLVRARPGSESPVNRKTLCIKGCYGYDFVHSPERLTNPQLKIEGAFHEVSWEQAIKQAANEFQQIIEENGPDSIAILGSSKCTNEENYLLQRLARGILGTNNIDNGSRLYNSASLIGLGWSIGFPGTTNSIKELEQSDLIMVIGANPVASAPAVGYAIKRAIKYGGAKLLLINPLFTKLASLAHLWVRPKVGTDLAFLNGMASTITKEKLLDDEFVTRRIDNYKEFITNLKENNIAQIEKTTGIPKQDIQLAARLFANADRASIVFGNGITQYANGVDSVKALANIAMLTGNIGGGRGGIFALQRENNAQGACDMGAIPNFLPGYQSLDDIQIREIFEKRWKVSLPVNVGFTALEMIKQINIGKIKGMLIVGENPVLSFPSPSKIKSALSSLKSLVVIDIFPSETAKLATSILPAASFAEKEGTVTNFEGRIQKINKVIEPLGNSRPDWEIILQLAREMGHPMPYSSPQQVMDEIEELVPLYQQSVDINLETDDEDWLNSKDYRLGIRRLHKGPFPRGFGRFIYTKYSPLNSHSNTYPLTLISGSILYHLGSGTRSLRASRLKKYSPEGWVEISIYDAECLKLSKGDRVRVSSEQGEVSSIVQVVDTLPPGILFMPISFPESSVNELFEINSDGESKIPSLKECAVKLERINDK